MAIESGDGDKFASVMAKILSEDLGGVAPILAKRKTALMKEMEIEKQSKHDSTKIKKQRKLEREQQLVVPSVDVTNYEKNLKKMASRGGPSNRLNRRH